VTVEAIATDPGTKVARCAAAIAATGALACGVCCVLPFALPAAVLAVSGGVLAWFGSLMPWATAAAVVVVVAGWSWIAVQSVRVRRLPAASTLLMMGFATALLLAALAWPRLEGLIFALLRH
jgi:hypothetical protein